MVRLVDEALRDGRCSNARRARLAGRDGGRSGRRHRHVPARRAAPDRRGRVEEDKGAGAVRGAIEAAAKRLIAFEMQFGPFAVAQLAIDRRDAGADAASRHSPMPELLRHRHAGQSLSPRTTVLGQLYEPIAASRRRPTRSSASSRSRSSSATRRTRRRRRARRLDRRAAGGRGAVRRRMRLLWMPPRRLGRRRARQAPEQPLRLFLALGDLEGVRLGPSRSGRRQQGARASSASSRSRAFSTAPASRRCARLAPRLRGDLGDRLLAGRASAGRVNTRIFQGVQQPVCIVLAARTPNKDRREAGCSAIHGAAEGQREHEKFAALEELTLTERRLGGLPERTGASRSCPGHAGAGRRFRR